MVVLSSLFRCTLVLLLFSSSLCCQQQPTADTSALVAKVSTPAPEYPSRRTLARTLFESKKVTIIYGDSSEELAQAYIDLFENFIQRSETEFELQLVPASKALTKQLQTDNLLVVGSWSSNPVFKQLTLSPNLIGLTSDQFGLGTQNYPAQQASFSLYLYPNPLQLNLPLSLIYGNNDQEVLKVLADRMGNSDFSFFWNSWDYEVFLAGERIRMGKFNEQTWDFNEGIDYDYTQQANESYQSEHFRLQTHQHQLPEKTANNLLRKLEKQWEDFSIFLGSAPSPSPKIDYQLFTRSEQKGMVTRNTAPAHYHLDKNKIFAIHNGIYQSHEPTALFEYLIEKNLGKAQTQGLQIGLSTYLTQNWQQQGYRHWASRLYHSDNLVSLSELLNNQRLSESSDLVTAPLLASFVDWLIDTYGQTFFLQNYSNWQPKSGEISRLEKAWHEHIKRQYPIIEATKNKPALPYLKGFNFAHEGYAVYNGYGSELAEKSLQKIKKVGGNAIAIVPYSYMRSPNQAKPLPLMRRAGTEDDPSVVRSAYDARQLGMTTLLKPQIWLNGSWPGDVQMDSEAAWEQWFDYYYHWILHYAMLAEIYQFDQFCLGVEFVTATREQPQRWKAILKKIRGVYSGPITYAANWGEEFENLDLWSELDFIGINCYYPLGQEEELTQSQLNQRFEDILQKVERVAKKYAKPVVFTEIGFRNVNQCWKNPHAEPNGRVANQQHQLMCYRAVAEGIRDKEWCKGILWWKWPSYMNYSQRNATSFTPCEKAAEQVVREMF